MSISIWTLGALALVLYFGWALVDPSTVEEVESRLARKRMIQAYGYFSPRLRYALGLVIGLTLLGFGIYNDISSVESGSVRAPAQATARALPKTAPAQSRALMDRIDNATLQKQIEHQERMSQYSEAPATGRP